MNKRRYLFPQIPFNFKDLKEVRDTIFNWAMLTKQISEDVSSSTDVSWVQSNFEITDDKYIF